jgi:hypothetical protein
MGNPEHRAMQQDRTVPSAEWLQMEEEIAAGWHDYKTVADDGRSGAVRQLVAITTMLGNAMDRHDPVKLQLLTPLTELVFALLRLRGGVVAPMLRPAKFNNRPSDSVDRNIMKIEAAVTMTILMERGFRREDAAKAVAAVLRDCGVKFNETKRDLWKRVAEWRDHVKSAVELALVFDRALKRERNEFARVTPQATPTEIRKRALGRLLCSLIEKSDEVLKASRSNIPSAAQQRLDKLLNTDLPRLRKALLHRAIVANSMPPTKSE